MILVLLIVIPILGGLLAWILGERDHRIARWVSFTAIAIDLVIAIVLWFLYYSQINFLEKGNWFLQYQWQWIPQLGISFQVAIDGISLLMVLLTSFLGVISVVVSWTEIRERVPLFHLNLMWVLSGVIGVFLSLDLFLFYFFWELMLVPMYFLIGIWGHENRIYASFKFFIFTQASGLLMLVAIIGLYFVHHTQTGIYTFNYFELLNTPVGGNLARWLMLGFLIAFVVKLPAFPFHTWLPDAHTEAPTAGSVILAGLLLKTGAYGIIRFAVPFFPEAALSFAPVAMIIGVIGIIYGAILAFAQNDLKRLVAYTSVSHLGFVLLGVFAWNELALQGAVMQMICHGLSTGALFILVGILQEHVHMRDMNRMGGLWEKVPRRGGVAMFFALASLGLPGLGNFVAEFLILAGVYKVNITLTALASAGLIFSTIYSLWIIQRTFHGEKREQWIFPDLSLRPMLVFSAMMAVLVWLGLFPGTVLNTARPAIYNLQRSIGTVYQYHQNHLENGVNQMAHQGSRTSAETVNEESQ
jgi:NADH-quinone oxidoreductase subunit M